MKLALIALVLLLPVAGHAQKRFWSGYPRYRYGSVPAKVNYVPDYARDGKWLVLSTNIARLEAKYYANTAMLKTLNALNTPKPEETRRITYLSTLTAAQERQLDLWKADQADIETRYQARDQAKKKP